MKSLFLAVAMMMAVCAIVPAYAYDLHEPCEAYFRVILQITEYGQRSVGVIIDAGKPVKSDGLDCETFKVWQHKVEWPGTSRERTAGFDGYRKVTRAYVNNEERIDNAELGAVEGRYIVLELEHGYFLGSEDHTYDPTSTRFALSFELTQMKPFGNVKAGDLLFTQIDAIDPVADSFMTGSFVSSTQNGYFRGYRMGQMDYALYSPGGEDAEAQYPLVVVFHGGLESKEFLKGMRREDKPQIMEYKSAAAFAAPAFQEAHGGAYVLAPWFTVMPQDWYYSDEGTTVVMELIDYIIREHPDINTNQIYLAGLSSGGGMVWSMLIHQDAKRFAGAIAIASVRLPTYEEARKIAAANLPIWLVHGAADKVIDVQNSRIPAGYFEDMGYGNYNYTELLEIISSETGIEYSAGSQKGKVKTVLSHLSWIPVFNNEILDEQTGLFILDWLFAQHR